ncbi:hypothetical protein TNCV_1401671 [Trichonephila clavipes]|nr:hypothetical protein TNCV_1401671 [Trichonephila clavipes]
MVLTLYLTQVLVVHRDKSSSWFFPIPRSLTDDIELAEVKQLEAIGFEEGGKRYRIAMTIPARTSPVKPRLP